MARRIVVIGAALAAIVVGVYIDREFNSLRSDLQNQGAQYTALQRSLDEKTAGYTALQEENRRLASQIEGRPLVDHEQPENTDAFRQTLEKIKSDYIQARRRIARDTVFPIHDGLREKAKNYRNDVENDLRQVLPEESPGYMDRVNEEVNQATDNELEDE